MTKLTIAFGLILSAAAFSSRTEKVDSARVGEWELKERFAVRMDDRQEELSSCLIAGHCGPSHRHYLSREASEQLVAGLFAIAGQVKERAKSEYFLLLEPVSFHSKYLRRRFTETLAQSLRNDDLGTASRVARNLAQLNLSEGEIETILHSLCGAENWQALAPQIKRYAQRHAKEFCG
jgi:hypothetical protein